MAFARILLVEDDRSTALLLQAALGDAGYDTVVAEDGFRGLAQALIEPFDLVILDRNLPDLDGLDLCQRLRREKDLPIIMLTAKGSVPDRIAGLQAGADDYMVKPFAADELIARIHARLRRAQPAPAPTGEPLSYADLVLWPDRHQVSRGGRQVQLTLKEFELLYLLIQFPEQRLHRERLMTAVWGADFEGESNVLDAYVRFLRKKLEANDEPRLIQTVRGQGYMLQLLPAATDD